MVNSTIKAYNQFASVYQEETKEYWDKFPRAIIDAFTSHLKGKNILVLGSGPGSDALLLKNAGLNITCLDASKAMIDITRKLGFKSVLKDFRNLAFASGSFDGIWAWTSLLHVREKEAERAIEQINKLLKPGGVFLIGMIEGEFSGYKARESMPSTKRFFKYYKEVELKNMVEKFGFSFIKQHRYQPHNTMYISQLFIKNL